MSDNPGINDDRAESPKRRSILGAVGAGITGTALTGKAGAHPPDGDDPELPGVTELHGIRKEFLVAWAMRTGDVDQLLEDAHEIGAGDVLTDDARAYRFDHHGETIRFVKLPLPDVLPPVIADGCSDEFDPSVDDVTDAHIGVRFEGFDASATTSVTTKDGEGTIYQCNIQPDGGEIASTTFAVEQDETGGEIRLVGGQGGEVGALSCGIDAPNVNKCTVCKAVVDFVCTYGCGLGATGICTAIGFVEPTVGAVCSAIAVGVCERKGDVCGKNTPERFCYNRGYCKGTPPV